MSNEVNDQEIGALLREAIARVKDAELRRAALSPATPHRPPWRALAHFARAARYRGHQSSELPHSQLRRARLSDRRTGRAAGLLLRLEIPRRPVQSSSRDRLKLRSA